MSTYFACKVILVTTGSRGGSNSARSLVRRRVAGRAEGRGALRGEPGKGGVLGEHVVQSAPPFPGRGQNHHLRRLGQHQPDDLAALRQVPSRLLTQGDLVLALAA